MITEYLKLNEIIDIIPLLLNYIIVSYFLNSLLSVFIDKNKIYYSISLLIISFIIAIIFVNIVEAKWFIKTCHIFNLYKTLKSDLLSDIIDSKSGMWFRVYIKEEKVIYMGILSRYENETIDGHRYIVLSAYSCYSFDGEELLNYDNNFTECVLLNIANINRIEMIYDGNSSKINSQ